MDFLSDLVAWFNASRIAVLISSVALVSTFYSIQSAKAARIQAASAERQVDQAERQVALGQQQVELLLRQIKNAEEAEEAVRRARRESLEPMVLVDIAPGVHDPDVFVLTIANVGKSIARKVRVKPLQEMVRSDGAKMHEWSVFKTGVETMPPGHKLQFFYDVGFQPFKGNSPKSVAFTVDCEGPNGAVQQSTYAIDLEPYAKAWSAPTTLGSAVKGIKKIAISIDNLSKAVEDSRNANVRMVEVPIVETSQLDDDWATWVAAEDPEEIRQRLNPKELPKARESPADESAPDSPSGNEDSSS